MPPAGVVLVPIRSFADPKTRLAASVTPSERSALTRELAEGVLGALGSHEVAVVTDDADVARWARLAGALALQPGTAGLNASVEAATATMAAAGHRRVAVVAADLALPGRLDEVLAPALDAARPDDTVTAVPDRHDDGTNVLVVPATGGFRFRYGPASFGRHRAEARRLGLRFDERRVDDLGWDVDTYEDLERYRAR